MCKQRLLKVLAGVLCLMVLGLMAVHLRLPRQSRWVLAQSGALERQGQRIHTALPSGPIAINTADEAELCRLSGVGPSLAQAILAERELNGPFAYPEDLVAVKGIGPKNYLKWKDQLSLK